MHQGKKTVSCISLLLLFILSVGVLEQSAMAQDDTLTAQDATLWIANYSDVLGWNSQPYYWQTIQFPDVNGDGKKDVCGRGEAGILCALSTGSAFGSITLWTANYSNATSWSSDASYWQTIQFPDVNGDGKADVCGRGDAGIDCALSSGSSFSRVTLWNGRFSNTDGWNADASWQTIRFPDANGDGKADVCGRGAAGIYCALSKGSAFGAVTLWTAYFSNDYLGGHLEPSWWQTIQFPDVNGDGKADICYRYYSGIECGLSSGSAFAKSYLLSAEYSDANGWSSQASFWHTIQFPDVNGDGKADVCGRASDGIYCELFNAKPQLPIGPIAPPPLAPPPSELPPPTVTSTCPGTTPIATISWEEGGRGSLGYYLDVDDNNNWDDGFWNKSVPTGTLTTPAPEGFNAFGGASGTLTFNSGSQYQVRVSYSATGEHSATTSFTADLCTTSPPPPPPPPPGPPPPPPPPPGGTTLQSFDTNNNNLIDDPEFFDIIDAWIAGQIDDSTFFQAVDLWVSQGPISSAGLEPKSLRLDSVVLAATGDRTMTFMARGEGITTLRVEIFDLRGLRIFSEETAGQSLLWSMTSQHAQPVANGVYLYVVTVRGADGKVIQSEVKKLVVLR